MVSPLLAHIAEEDVHLHYAVLLPTLSGMWSLTLVESFCALFNFIVEKYPRSELMLTMVLTLLLSYRRSPYQKFPRKCPIDEYR